MIAILIVTGAGMAYLFGVFCGVAISKIKEG